jgi:imidazole glycerol-phosphate synthase subunit HisH
MTRLTIGIVDYGVGNLASVRHALRSMGYRSRSSSDREILGAADLLLLPGVGAFPAAMQALHTMKLVDFIRQQAGAGKPVLGICLGMQLLAESSTEWQFTAGIGLIPGEVLPLSQADWHIGWNALEVTSDDPMFRVADRRTMYFNHSYAFHPPSEYRVAVARIGSRNDPFTVAVRRKNVVGLQFHPEKSQADGRLLLSNVIEGLCHA